MTLTFICPFNLEQLTGTPTRARTTIDTAKKICSVSVVSSVQKESFFSFSKRVFFSLRKNQPDILHCFTTLSVPIALFYKIFLHQRTKIVFEMHGWSWYETKDFSFLKRATFLFFDLLGLWFSDNVIAMSYSEKKFLSTKTFHASKISVLWGPVVCENEYTPISDQQNFTIGYLGNGSWWQGLHHVITAAKILVDKRKDISFLLAGFDFSDEKKYPKISNIRYIGKVGRADVVPTLHRAHVLISPRLKEKVSDLQYPQKLSEYLAAGRSVLASNASDQELIIKKADCGMIVYSLDERKMAEAIEDMIHKGRAELERMGKNAFAFAKKNLSTEAIEAELKKIYST